jgi:Helicase conserved C-terminal domain
LPDVYDSEVGAAGAEESAAALVSVALPEERRRIRDLLAELPGGVESKTDELLRGLGDLWRSNPSEKVVVFTTYLGSVDALRDAIDKRFPGKGVEVLKGGDHGAKIAAEKRFKRTDGPRVLICTAAGREGINLQFARVLFNHDLPWNPMDMEQRIGRIHRYGQKDTAQVYNLVSADTIEGQIYLLLEQKLLAIGEALGKVDEYGQVTEDLRSQVLGQLAERISYDQLYQDAVRDPTLKRSRQELEVALTNAKVARDVVFELFQDLEGFRLDDYRQFDDGGQGMQRLLAFTRECVRAAGGTMRDTGGGIHEASLPGGRIERFTTDRAKAKAEDDLALLGLEHPLVREFMDEYRALPAEQRALRGRLRDGVGAGTTLTVWRAEVHGAGGQFKQVVLTLGLSADGERVPQVEALGLRLGELTPSESRIAGTAETGDAIRLRLPDMVRRELQHRGLLTDDSTVAMSLIAYVQLS